MKRLKICAVACLTLLVGCGGEGSTSGPDLETGAEAGPPAPSASGGSGSGASRSADAIDLDLTAPAVLGEDIDLSDYAGQDLALWFWAPW